MQISNCLILCGGQGRRIRDYKADTHKSLLNVGGQKFIYHLLAQFKAFDITLCTGYLSEQFEALFNNSDKINISRENQPLGTGGAILNAIKSIKDCDTFLVVNGDSYCNFNINHFIESFKAKEGDFMVLTTDDYDEYTDFGMINVKNGKIISFNEKVKSLTPGSLKNCGIYIFNKKILEKFDMKYCSLEKDIIPNLIKHHNCYAHNVSTKVYDIGTAERINIANNYFNSFCN